MSVKRTSATIVLGTVLTPDLLQTLADDCDASFASAPNVRRYREDFFTPGVTITGAGNVSSFQFTTLTNGSASSSGGVGSLTNYAGLLTCANMTNSALTVLAHGPAFQLSSTADFYSTWRIAIKTRASLSTIAGTGLQVYFGSAAVFGFAAGNDSAFWNVIQPNGTISATSVGITNGQTYTLQCNRVAGAVTYKIDGATVFSGGDTQTGTVSPSLIVHTGAVTSDDQIYCDFVGVDLITPSVG